MPKKINPNAKASPSVEEAMAKFTPAFGNDNHLAIIKEYTEIKNLITLAEGHEARMAELKKIDVAARAERVKIRDKELHLLWLLEQDKKLSTESTG